MRWACRCCGGWHDELPMSYAFDAPAAWYGVPEAERARRTLLTEEQCEIDGRHFFVRGIIDIPVQDHPDGFGYVVWVSLSAANYQRMIDDWTRLGRERNPPAFGWLSTAIPGYPSTLNLKTMVTTRPVGQRPTIELEPTDHPLAIEQRAGITLEQVQAIAERLLHPPGAV